MQMTENKLKFSILVATFNHQKTIKQTLLSCLSQEYQNYEILVSDDSSSDSTWDIVSSLKDPKIRAIKQLVNIGEYNNRNFLLKQAKGEFVIFIDGEDLIYPYGLSFITNFIDKYPNAKILVARSWDENIVYPHFMDNFLYAKNQFIGYGLSALNFTNLIFNRDAILSIGGFDNQEIRFGDAYIQLKLGLIFGVLLIPEGFSWWRRTNGQASEKYLQDQFLFFNEENKYIPSMINETKLLTSIQKKQALNNYYGNILRFCIRKLFSKQILKSVKYLVNYHVPFAYYKSISNYPKRNFYTN
jgi:glycosyltransferase involved in cell wall biosynthesis